MLSTAEVDAAAGDVVVMEEEAAEAVTETAIEETEEANM